MITLKKAAENIGKLVAYTNEVPIVFNDGGEFEDTAYWLTDCCHKPVSLPDGWKERAEF